MSLAITSVVLGITALAVAIAIYLLASDIRDLCTQIYIDLRKQWNNHDK